MGGASELSTVPGRDIVKGWWCTLFDVLTWYVLDNIGTASCVMDSSFSSSFLFVLLEKAGLVI